MEGDLGLQVAPPIFIHHPTLPSRYCEPPPAVSKKRDLPWQGHGGFHHQPPLQPGRQSAPWNPKGYVWDSAAFVARPAAHEVDLLRLGAEQRKAAAEVATGREEDEEGLTLKLGGSGYSPPPEEAALAAARASKRVRSRSPGGCGGGGSYPMCQVDDCKADLSKARDYHRRHKVCEVHSKTTKALVGKHQQRFCQQCSRFHLLAEFDEGKRSCRRRLAGHNRRRRKTQPQDVPSGLVLSGNRENNGGGNLDIVNLLTALAHLQGNDVDKAANMPPLLDRERLIKILGKINSLPDSADAAERASSAEKFDLNLSNNLQSSMEQMSQSNYNPSGPSTMDLLTVVSAALASSSPDKPANFTLGTNKSNNHDENSRSNCYRKDEELIVNAQRLPVALGENGRSKGGVPPPAAPEVRTNIPLQLFSSSPDDDSPPKLASSRKYFSSDSSNPMEERSPSSSPPVVRKLFPLHSLEQEKVSVSNEDNLPAEVSVFQRWASPAGLFKSSNSRAENSAVSNPPYQAGCTLSSGSDHSPSSSNTDSQERTGRIIFKLFDKDLSKFPGTLRNQIFNWLSNSPSEMESHIRPGCVVLAVYASMSQFAWEEFQEDLLRRISLLIENSDSDFWSSCRFLVQTDRQLVSHKDGKLRLCKSWKTWSAPELISVSPLAVVAGKETPLVLRGHNLAVPGTRIHCTFMGGYVSKEVSVPSCSGAIYDDSCSENFVFPGGLQSKLGRCFMEVENGFKGNSFPLIIADATVCQELRMLESDFDRDTKMEEIAAEDQDQHIGQPMSREVALHFLNELGWLFQRHCSSNGRFPVSRFKFLFTYSIERDWTALVRTLLDILLEENRDNNEISEEILVLLSEVQLLNRAVKRKCRKMVDLLLHYSWNFGSDASKTYVFPPNAPGPGGVTALHLAACTRDSEEMVDALTNDPQEIGLKCWNSSMDENKHTPYMYAFYRNHHSYNKLVARKIGDRNNGQVTIPLTDSEISLDQPCILTASNRKVSTQPLQARSCAQCSIINNRQLQIPGSQGLLHRPYIHSMLAIAAVCVCVCLLFRGLPQIGSVAPFKWENVDYGPL